MKKKPSERRVIILKQSKQLSPIKEVGEHFNPHSSNFNLSDKPKIPRIVAQQKLTSSELDSISHNSDLLISIELMRKIVDKNVNGLEHFYEQCPPVFKQVFEICIKNVCQSFNHVKQQRMQRLKDENIEFVPPNKDYFEQQKGRVLNNCIKQKLQAQKKKQRFRELASEQCKKISLEITKKIKEKSQVVPRQPLEVKFQAIATDTKEHNEHYLEHGNKELKSNLLTILSMSDQMLHTKIKQYGYDRQYPNLTPLQYHQRRNKNQRGLPQNGIYKHQAALFLPEDYLY